uniref:Uncharacterized protein n=1 Tax=Periophthalmus magnuspinnatus TaxID=409849 RepID=A0A3B4AD55_9GOBI
MAPIRDSVSHSPNQTGLEHPGLDSQYEPSPWSSGSPCSTDSNTNWSKVLVDGRSDPELASECMDADCSSSVGSDKCLAPIIGPSHYTVAGPISNNLGNHNKLLNNSGVWGSQSDSNLITGGSAPCINGGLNPHVLKINANHGAWPQGRASSPASQDQRPSQAPGITSKQSIAPQQGPVLGWGGMAAPGNKMEDEMNNGTASTKVLGSSSGNGGQSANLNTESNGPNNTIKMNTTTTTTTTNTIMTSTQPNSIASSQFMGDCSWGTIGVGTGAPRANGNLLAPQPTQADLGGKGAFGTPWGASTYPGDKGPPNADTVNLQNPTLMQAGNPQISSAAFKSNNNHNNTGAPRWDQGPSNNPANSHSTISWTGGSADTMGPPTGMPRPWGSNASSSSSCSSSSSMSKMSHGEWGSATPSNPPSDSQKGSSSNGWKSLEDDAMGMGNAGGGHGLGAGTAGWGRSGGSEGSGESSGGRSSSDRDNSLKGSNRRKGAHTATLISALTRSNVDPRVLSNAGWGQTPVRQNTAWDVNSAPTHQQAPRDEQKHPGWGAAQPAPSQTSAGWGNAGPDPGWGEQRPMSTWENKASGNGGSSQSGWDEGSNSSNTWSNNMNKDEGSNMWSNAPKPAQSWNGSAGESWGNNGEASRAGASNHWGDPPKGAGSMGWESDSDRSGSGCWSEPGRNNTSSSNTWGGSGGSNTPDHSTPNPGSNWGEPVHKPSPMTKHQGWGEPMKNNSSTQNWGESASKPHNPSNEWGKGPESSASRGGQGPNKPSGWLGGPMPAVGPKEEMATGWEEPSPESVRRKMEIDDGTAAWGDPGKYGGGSVNMWNKPGQVDQDGPSTPNQNHSSMRAPQPMQPQPQEKTSGTGWGDPYPSQKESSTWGEPAPPVPVTVDNGTSAWGKPMDTSGWEDSGRDNRESSGWGGQQKSGPKPMGTWGGDESNTWDQEEEVEIGMWNDSQQDTRSHDQNTWNYKQKNSKMSKPVPKQDEPWMKPFVNQFNSMGFSRDSSEEPMKPGMMLDKRMDMGSMGDLNGVMGKNLGSRHPLHKDPMDRSPYFDKNVKSLVGGISVAQGRGGPQSQVPPQHSLRNQVPAPILPSQVAHYQRILYGWVIFICK